MYEEEHHTDISCENFDIRQFKYVLYSSPNATDCCSFTAQDIPVCVGEISDAFRVHVEAIDDYTPLPPHSFAATLKYTNETTTLTFQAFDSDLPPNQLYSIVIEAENRAGGTNSTGMIQLSELMHTECHNCG